MAIEIAPVCITCTAGGTITQYQLVEISADWTVTACNATTDVCVGIAQNAASSGGTVSVAIGGVSKYQANGAVTAGAWIGPSADGQGTALAGGTADNVHAIGQSLDSPGEAAALGSVLIDRCYFIADNS